MSIPEKNPARINNSDFLPAMLKENKSGWLVEYYARNPKDNTLKRKQIRLKRIVLRYNKKRDARKRQFNFIARNSGYSFKISFKSRTFILQKFVCL